ncbi:hypothetical protein Bca101_059400 [Brassica carinata]
MTKLAQSQHTGIFLIPFGYHQTRTFSLRPAHSYAALFLHKLLNKSSRDVRLRPIFAQLLKLTNG